ncbi:MAG: endonuclease [Lactobacillus sp.]|nr:endonuclease [Lactobacillus sp.]
MKKLLKIILAIIAFLAVIFAGYVIYLQMNYYRIPDHQKLAIKHNPSQELQKNKHYTITTYNIGFGAYSANYTFFMDKGEMKDGTKKQGYYGTARSYKEDLRNTEGAIKTIANQHADINLFQEIDTNSTRSFHINQVKMAEKTLQGASIFASNFHTGFLFYPLYQPHGIVHSGILTLSRYRIAKAVRRSYPVTSSFVSKYFDLDRCFSISYLPVKNGKYLVLINSHMSAYDKGGVYRKKQLNMLKKVMEKEYAKGNYVICGGDFNHALSPKLLTYFKSAQKVPDWVAVISQKDMKNMKVVYAKNAPTARGDDIPYKKDYTYTTVIDGFIVSPNVKATAHNIDTGFKYSDHNPVKLDFVLK